MRSNLVTEADTQSEALIRQIIAASFPRDVVLGEESGASAGDTRHRWIVDPLDGTTNYAHGYRCFCVSIAFEREGTVELGVVYDPMADELYEARRGAGAGGVSRDHGHRGRFDGFWEPGLHAWDIAAGILLVAEAGGRTSDYLGQRASLDGEQLIASNGKIHEAMVQTLRPYAGT